MGVALGVIDEANPRREWDAYDLPYRDNKIEVKASGRSQSWNPDQSRSVSFDIAPKKRSWDAAADTVTHHHPPKRIADVYVFCEHKAVPATSENVADPNWWRFWVVPTETLDRELGSQKSVGVARLSQLAALTPWTSIRRAVDTCIDRSHIDH